jgi:hypothetical protein
MHRNLAHKSFFCAPLAPDGRQQRHERQPVSVWMRWRAVSLSPYPLESFGVVLEQIGENPA